uniref:PIN domain-containing protein n=1 Tax=Pyramimonas obovata TaxID=1411642 RepID=A0A7S0R6F8_9CHLO|mmetsp:Transcript_2661/g.5503  ORF Transcript_2661/g.5503 Transcript_2661/m.5503 type:complete len:248 (+) Transcript_2661:108-851(+)
MKLKRQRAARRNFRLYCVYRGLREPYKVLIDGNFLHAVLQMKLGDLNEELPKLLGGTCKLGVTKCITSELRSLGETFAASGRASKKMDHFRCSHINPVPAVECVEALVGEENPENLVVCTQDANLKSRLMKLKAGVPVLFVSAHGLQLEPPSDFQKKLFEEMAAASLEVPQHEQKLVAVDDKTPKPKKKVKGGANPLSCRKRKTQATSQPSTGEAAPAAGEGKHKRKRQRHKKKGDQQNSGDTGEAM